MAKSPATPGPDLFAWFLRDNGIRIREAAEALGVSHAAVVEWKTGASRPRHDRRRDIETWTSGAVPASAWRVEGEREPVLDVAPWRPEDA